MDELMLSLISGVVGGLIVWFFQQWYSNRREKRKEKEALIASPLHVKKLVTSAILDTLKPGRNINLMFEALGEPAIKLKSDLAVFADNSIDTHSYLYVLKNAYIKITSKDNETIDTLTVFPNDLSFRLEGIPNPTELEVITLNQTQIKRFDDKNFGHTVIVARHDETFAIEITIVNPLNLMYTYFGYFGGDNYMGNWQDYKSSNDPKAFIGGTITGLCISGLDKDAFYIYAYEV